MKKCIVILNLCFSLFLIGCKSFEKANESKNFNLSYECFDNECTDITHFHCEVSGCVNILPHSNHNPHSINCFVEGCTWHHQNTCGVSGCNEYHTTHQNTCRVTGCNKNHTTHSNNSGSHPNHHSGKHK